MLQEVTTLVTTLALVAEGASDKNLGSDASASALGQALPVAIKLRSLNKEFLASLAEVAPSEQGKLEILEGFAKSFETAMSQYLKKACEQLKDTKRVLDSYRRHGIGSKWVTFFSHIAMVMVFKTSAAVQYLT